MVVMVIRHDEVMVVCHCAKVEMWVFGGVLAVMAASADDGGGGGKKMSRVMMCADAFLGWRGRERGIGGAVMVLLSCVSSCCALEGHFCVWLRCW